MLPGRFKAVLLWASLVSGCALHPGDIVDGDSCISFVPPFLPEITTKVNAWIEFENDIRPLLIAYINSETTDENSVFEESFVDELRVVLNRPFEIVASLLDILISPVEFTDSKIDENTTEVKFKIPPASSKDVSSGNSKDGYDNFFNAKDGNYRWTIRGNGKLSYYANHPNILSITFYLKLLVEKETSAKWEVPQEDWTSISNIKSAYARITDDVSIRWARFIETRFNLEERSIDIDPETHNHPIESEKARCFE